MSGWDWVVLILTIWGMLLANGARVRRQREEDELNKGYSVQDSGGEKVEEELINSMKPPIVCNTEIMGNQIYVWDKETSKFLIQAKTMEDIVKYFTDNYPGRKIILSQKGEQLNGS